MKKKLTPIMAFHLTLMVFLILVSLVILIAVLSGSNADTFQSNYGSFSAVGYLSLLINIAALCCGILYLAKGYTKKAAAYYKAFIVLAAVLEVINLALAYTNAGFDLRTILMIVKVVLLFALAFWKDLGKRNTWILYSIMVAVDLILFFTNGVQGILVYRLAALLCKLAMDGTIGLAVRGKYADKDARGTK